MLDREIINALLEIKAVELRVDKENWFTWASGIKSPIYCDNRLTMSYPKIRKQIAEGFVKKIKELYPNVDYIVGTATAGIPHAAWISDIMDLPMLYNLIFYILNHYGFKEENYYNKINDSYAHPLIYQNDNGLYELDQAVFFNLTMKEIIK